MFPLKKAMKHPSAHNVDSLSSCNPILRDLAVPPKLLQSHAESSNSDDKVFRVVYTLILILSVYSRYGQFLGLWKRLPSAGPDLKV